MKTPDFTDEIGKIDKNCDKLLVYRNFFNEYLKKRYDNDKIK